MNQFVGQLMLASFNFAPRGWLMCNGQLLGVNQTTALFALLGTAYGGNGIQNFALPNLQGRTPVGVGNGIVQGQVGGEDAHTLYTQEVPQHNHVLQAGAAANLTKPGAAIVAAGGANFAVSSGNLVQMNAGVIANTGSSQPHENRQPFLVMTWCIALNGIFPSRG